MKYKRILYSGALRDPAAPAPEERLTYLNGLKQGLSEEGCELKYFSMYGESGAHFQNNASVRDLFNWRLIVLIVQLGWAGWKEGVAASYAASKLNRLSMLRSCCKMGKMLVSFTKAMNTYQPDAVILYSQFKPEHLIAALVCGVKGITPLYTHTGVLPGSIGFEWGGQMAESPLARTDFQTIRSSVDEKALAQAQEYLCEMRSNPVDRKRQKDDSQQVEALVASFRAKGKRVVFYAGSNDYESGISPRWAKRSQIHSPHYDSSLAAVVDLAKYAEDQNFEILFKPHPHLNTTPQDVQEFPAIHFIGDGNVNALVRLSDVTATLVSTVSYLSVLMKKPCIQMGMNSMEASEAVYVIDADHSLPDALKQSLEFGLTPEMEERFEIFVAYLCEAYLSPYSAGVSSYFKTPFMDHLIADVSSAGRNSADQLSA